MSNGRLKLPRGAGKIMQAVKLCDPCQTGQEIPLHPLACAIPPLQHTNTMIEHHQYATCMNCFIIWLVVIAEHLPTGQKQTMMVREDTEYNGIVPDQEIISALRR